MDEVDRLRRRLDRERRARRAAELIAEQSTRDALHDPLTGLANRSLLISRLTDALRRHGTGGEVVVAYVDLDRFKHINDTYGHEFGDGVLVEVAERLRHAVRETDTVGRIGGDEFVVVATALSPALTTALVARIAEAVDFTYAGKGPALPVNGSIGVAIPSGDADNAYDVLRDADNAMYHAKSDGRGVTVHAHSVQQAARRRLQLTSDCGPPSSTTDSRCMASRSSRCRLAIWCRSRRCAAGRAPPTGPSHRRSSSLSPSAPA